ncbi:septal ring lytic transglycosylase RlpA family protein [Hymenobacter jeollabukensis]|uniref:Probable endolytic peptidoglycan transglycosylase RlpA n=1 Tax=Hymenobacter jeollabukensis TaxID=2025313 RepID=A0A5R8WU87_9BACT|nr:septal ring lytic transglycosylase RlpA family protein [Hymenobacter jeollabukensis]TLM95329.1 septal ring lytic transglycosylase RlpA family protein [Hymenobacter jeollabukensis]
MKFKQRQNLSGLLMMWLTALLLVATSLSSFADDTPTATASKGAVLRGRASWYGREHQGHRTSSGTRFDRNKYTCAHKTLPFGTKLRVTNPSNGKAVVVEVTDRGPYRHQRILDLSEIAARPLDIVRMGALGVVAEIVPDDTPLGPVAGTVTVPEPEATDVAVTETTPETEATYVVQAGTFGELRNAEALMAQIKSLDAQLPVAVRQDNVNGRPLNRVIVGQRMPRSVADDVWQRLQNRGINGLVRQAENL